MNQGERILLIAIILLLDVFIFMIPLTGFFAVYVIGFRPQWFRAWIERLYESR